MQSHDRKNKGEYHHIVVTEKKDEKRRGGDRRKEGKEGSVEFVRPDPVQNSRYWFICSQRIRSLSKQQPFGKSVKRSNTVSTLLLLLLFQPERTQFDCALSLIQSLSPSRSSLSWSITVTITNTDRYPLFCLPQTFRKLFRSCSKLRHNRKWIGASERAPG